LTTDVTNVQMSFQMMTRIMIRAPLMLLFAMGMVVLLSPRLSLIFVGILPILLLGVFLITKKAGPAFRKMFKAYDRLNNVVQENLRGIRVVKSYVREEREMHLRAFHRDGSRGLWGDDLCAALAAAVACGRCLPDTAVTIPLSDGDARAVCTKDWDIFLTMPILS
jgi:ABC-type multidrug transport system fused ATPase/permease subunit